MKVSKHDMEALKEALDDFLAELDDAEDEQDDGEGGVDCTVHAKGAETVVVYGLRGVRVNGKTYDIDTREDCMDVPLYSRDAEYLLIGDHMSLAVRGENIIAVEYQDR